MKYYVTSKFDGATEEVTKERAKELLATGYVERVCTFDEMLEVECIYPLMSCYLETKNERKEG